PPWCAGYSGRGGRNCGFVSFEQCMMTATPGTGGSCPQNPLYLWYGPNRSSAPGRVVQPRGRGDPPLGRKTIRAAIGLVLAAGPLSAIDARPSGAETYRPWCAVYTGRSGGRNCSFNSFEQCMMTAGPGTGAPCAQNPWYFC